MKFLKSTICAALMGVCVFGLCACGGGASLTNEQYVSAFSQTAQSITSNTADNSTSQVNTVRTAIKAYEAEAEDLYEEKTTLSTTDAQVAGNITRFLSNIFNKEGFTYNGGTIKFDIANIDGQHSDVEILMNVTYANGQIDAKFIMTDSAANPTYWQYVRGVIAYNASTDKVSDFAIYTNYKFSSQGQGMQFDIVKSEGAKFYVGNSQSTSFAAVRDACAAEAVNMLSGSNKDINMDLGGEYQRAMQGILDSAVAA